jgi:predicted nucleotidyltransferase
MRRDQVIEKLRAHADAIRGFGVDSLYLFGSTGRNEARPDSDVDLFADPDYSRFTLFEWVDLQTFLADVLDLKVDFTTRNALHPALRSRIERSATRVL